MQTTLNPEPTPAKLALSIPEVLDRIPIKRTRLYEELRTGSLRHKKVGTRTIILAADLDDWLAGLNAPSVQEQEA